MRGLFEYVMRGRKQAILMIVLFNLIPFLGWLSDVIVALVTLRKGAKEGFLVLMWAVLPSIVFAVIGHPQFWFYNVVGGSLMVYLSAITLRNTNSWATVLCYAMLLGIVGVIAVHIYNPDIAADWAKQLSNYVQWLKGQWSTTLDFKRMETAVPLFAKFGTGLQIIFILVSDLVSLLVARWGQSLLYNPNALQPELLNIRLGYIAIGTLVLLVLGSTSGIAVAIDSMPLVLMSFSLAGLSLLHGAITLTKASKAWLFGFYGLWVLLFPYLTMLLVFAALMDCKWNFRHRLQLRKV